MMKTVSEWLRETDRKELVQLYVDRYPIDFLRIRNEDMKVSEVYVYYQQKVDNYIGELLVCESRQDSEMVFIAVESYEQNVETKLISLKELMDDDIETYSWICHDWEDVLGYHVAETERTLNYIVDVLAYIFYDMSFIGYTKEAFEEERDNLFKEDIIGSFATAEELFEFCGIPTKMKDHREEILKEEIELAKLKYNSYCFERELEELRRLLSGNQYVS